MRAALEGKVLILDGIEKAERNVLPTLNNLLGICYDDCGDDEIVFWDIICLYISCLIAQ